MVQEVQKINPPGEKGKKLGSYFIHSEGGVWSFMRVGDERRFVQSLSLLRGHDPAIISHFKFAAGMNA